MNIITYCSPDFSGHMLHVFVYSGITSNDRQRFCLASGMFHNENAEEAQRPYSGDEDENEAEVNGNWTPQEKALHEARLKAKAKRRQRKSSSRNSTSESFSEPGDVAGGDPHSPKGKVHTNDRKSRTGKGRGLPKKGLFGLVWCATASFFLLLFF